ncbi:hypothetical protein [Nannocystis punicea]|uniref:Uncharacterized protein n=1 Tax=Nannocystis punicea TaxID=2995304 RepID=A0ABY7HA99_9BACT|nr:hypothetical protein [Nannocystis poenicansa]WAS96032.1 hypothetical protein O0S08_07695 [Nannocystis poenicansa]
MKRLTIMRQPNERMSMKKAELFFVAISAVAPLSLSSHASGASFRNESSVASGDGEVLQPRDWTPYISEDTDPAEVECPEGSAVNGVRCHERFCDDISLWCAPTGGSFSDTRWTPHFSEEERQGFCPAGHWMTGISCEGGYCDAIALRCGYNPAAQPQDCHWTGWVSEENGGELRFAAGYFAQAAECEGSNCDNKRFYVCRM